MHSSVQAGFFLTLLALLQRRCLADGSGASGSVAEPWFAASCTALHHVMVGHPFQLSPTNREGPCLKAATKVCSFEDQQGFMAGNTTWSMEDGQYVFHALGNYTFSCGVTDFGSLTVVRAIHSIALCRGCSEGGVHVVNSEEVVVWRVTVKEGEKCKALVEEEGGNSETAQATADGFGYYQFIYPGDYSIYCENDALINAKISVVNESSPGGHQYQLLLYMHAAVMLLSFGVLLPTGAFLALHQKRLLHKILQPLALILGLSGVVIIVTYNELSKRRHFSHRGSMLHGSLGLILLLLAVVVMPLLLIRKGWRRWHKRCGHLVAFFGIGVSIVGLAILPISLIPLFLFRFIYTIWLIVAALIYVFYAPKTTLLHPISSERATMSVNGVQRNSSSCSGLQSLKRPVISENKMVELRKMSVGGEAAGDYLASEAFGREREERRDDEGGESCEQSGRREKEDQNGATKRPVSSVWTAEETSDSSMTKSGKEEEEEEEKVKVEEMVTRNQVTFPKQGVLVTAHNPYQPPSHVLVSLADNASITSSDSTRITRHSPRAWQRWIMLKNQPTVPRVELEVSHASPRASVATFPAQLPPGGTGFLPPPASSITIPHSTLSPITSTSYTPQPSPSHSLTHLQDDPCSTRGLSPCSVGDDSVFNESSPRPHKKVSLVQSGAPRLTSLKRNYSLSVDALRSHSDFHFGGGRGKGGVWRHNSMNLLPSFHSPPEDPVAVICTNRAQEIILWNSGAVKMFGYRSTEAIGSSLELIIPQRHKARHRQAVAQRSAEFTKYFRKYSYAPPDQKKARVLQTHGVAKNGNEFPVEVKVSSFLVDGALYYTGLITEVGQGSRWRQGSPVANSDWSEAAVRRKALVLGAQMKIAHNLASTESVSRAELSQLLAGALEASGLEAGGERIKSMMAEIVRAGDVDDDALPFTSLIPLLPKHGLDLLESGFVARGNRAIAHGNRAITRSNSVVVRNVPRSDRAGRTRGCVAVCRRPAGYLWYKLGGFWQCLIWACVYVVLNVALLVVTVAATDRMGWERWSFGTGPVLSLNCVLVLLPTLKSLVHNMRSSSWMEKIFPLFNPVFAHALFSLAILFWSLLHISAHLCSHFFQRTDNSSYQLSSVEEMKSSLAQQQHTVITGFLLLLLLGVLALSSVRRFRVCFQFVPFFVTHWMATLLFYLLLLTHGDGYFNPSFWKWLLPAAILVTLERIYRYSVITWFNVKLLTAAPYSTGSSVAVVEVERPRGFRFQPGQYILLNIPWIGRFHWQLCYISGGLDGRLVVYLPWHSGPWLQTAITYLKAHPYSSSLLDECQGGCELQAESIRAGPGTLESNMTNFTEVSSAPHVPCVHIAGPFGVSYEAVMEHRVCVLVCGDTAPHSVRPLLEHLLKCKERDSCSCHPPLFKLYLVWVIPSGRDLEWFTNYLAMYATDAHWKVHLEVRVFLTAIPYPPDDLSALLLQLGLRVSPPSSSSPSSSPLPLQPLSQPQLNGLFSQTTYGVPDFCDLFATVSAAHSGACAVGGVEVGVVTVGPLPHTTTQDLREACHTHSQSGKLILRQYHFRT